MDDKTTNRAIRNKKRKCRNRGHIDHDDTTGKNEENEKTNNNRQIFSISNITREKPGRRKLIITTMMRGREKKKKIITFVRPRGKGRKPRKQNKKNS